MTIFDTDVFVVDCSGVYMLTLFGISKPWFKVANV